jgi:hypothetical protein
VLEVLTPQALNTDSAAGAATEGNDLDLDSEDDDIATGGLTLALDVNDAALSADAPPSSAPVGA